ncbi:MAG: hypothetical protein FWG89_03290 [Treponema sp.]|nr:hypothetical protein [Treponema sp.]
MYIKKNTAIVLFIIAVVIIAAGIAVLSRDIPRIRQEAALTAADLAQADILYYDGVKAIGMVNGEPFFEFDLNVYAMEFRAAVAAHYGQAYNISLMGARFWDTEYDGQTPRQFLERLALDDLVKNMVTIQEARKRGIDTPEVFHDLEEERAAWNAPTDDIVFGPRTLGPAEFNSYRITGIRDMLKTYLLGNELAPTIEQLQAAYDSAPDWQKIAPLIVTGIHFRWDEDTVSNETLRPVLELNLKDGLSPGEIVLNLSGSVPGLAYEEFSIDSRFISREDTYEQGIAENLWEGDIGSCVIGPEDRPEVYYIINKEGGHVMRLEEAPVVGRNKWINDQYEIFINQKIKEARVTLFPR